MSQITIEQHFVPQVHLKKFVDHHDKKLFVYDKNFKRLHKKFYPVQVCKKDLLYEFDIENPNNGIENTFSYIETKFSDLYEKKLKYITHIEGDVMLSNDEKLIILYYVLRMDYGNIVNKSVGEEQFWQIWEESIIENCESEEELQIAYEKMNKEKILSEQRRIPVQVKTVFSEFIPILFNKKKINFIYNKDSLFISSDNPVYNYTSRNFQYNGFYGPTIFQINYQLAVSPRLMIWIDDKTEGDKESRITLDSKNIFSTDLNSFYFRSSNKYIYSNRILSESEVLLYKQNHI